MRKRARRLTRLYNQTTEEETGKRREMLHELFGRVGVQSEVEPPFYCDYGCHIFAGDGVFLNFGCVILDCNYIYIGDNVMCGPYTQIYAARHPVKRKLRMAGPEQAAAIRIEDHAWIGGGVLICPGVTIGENTVIGAGSVVTRDIPPNVTAAGNPCRVFH
jgi:maltose O-acetyltransferase